MKSESLHNHTTASDGKLGYLELLAAAERQGVGVMAITDHDALPGPSEMAKLRTYTGPVKWTVGIELTSYVPKAVGGPEMGALHVLGLFVNPKYQPLLAFCRNAEQGRVERMLKMLDRLHELGFKVAEADVRRHATSQNIVLPHIVGAVLDFPENRELMETLRLKMAKDAENNADLKANYDRMMQEGPQQYPYAIFMTRRSYLPMVVDDMGNLLDLEGSVRLIREAGGIAVMAHWFLNDNKLDQAGLEAVLASGGLDGLESVIVNTIGGRDPKEDTDKTRALIKQYGVIETMGSDAHSEGDLKAFGSSHYAAESVGQTAAIIERVKPDLHWSNL